MPLWLNFGVRVQSTRGDFRGGADPSTLPGAAPVLWADDGFSTPPAEATQRQGRGWVPGQSGAHPTPGPSATTKTVLGIHVRLIERGFDGSLGSDGGKPSAGLYDMVQRVRSGGSAPSPPCAVPGDDDATAIVDGQPDLVAPGQPPAAAGRVRAHRWRGPNHVVQPNRRPAGTEGSRAPAPPPAGAAIPWLGGAADRRGRLRKICVHAVPLVDSGSSVCAQ